MAEAWRVQPAEYAVLPDTRAILRRHLAARPWLPHLFFVFFLRNHAGERLILEEGTR
jgi:hypothetical protein